MRLLGRLALAWIYYTIIFILIKSNVTDVDWQLTIAATAGIFSTSILNLLCGI